VPDEVISEQRMPLDSARLLVTRTLARRISVGWFTGEDWHIPAWDDMLRREAGNLRLPPLVTPTLHALPEAPHKIQCMIGDLALEAELHALSGELPPGVSGYFTHRDYLECFPQGVEKAGGLVRLGGALGVAPEEMVAIGDGENDLGMLRAVGLAIAMDNALPAVKAAAQWTTTSNEEAGVAVAIAALRHAGRL
jgi:hydroxymethylpyrimidine pyrophosphatase-like HAD family hydrolase